MENKICALIPMDIVQNAYPLNVLDILYILMVVIVPMLLLLMVPMLMNSMLMMMMMEVLLLLSLLMVVNDDYLIVVDDDDVDDDDVDDDNNGLDVSNIEHIACCILRSQICNNNVNEYLIGICRILQPKFE